ncbi:hypothetical protein [Streptomyces sp. CRN 30]|uniref:hypothetical protein n=1 Tax=Streptomyces sp. CRN 30 TaxID=3075613 RepID=UPI0039C2AC4E
MRTHANYPHHRARLLEAPGLGTGHLPAAAVLRCLTERTEEGGTRLVGLAPARTAAWLTGPYAGAVVEGLPGAGYDRPDAWLTEASGPPGRLRYAPPPVSFAGGPGDWARPPGPWGADGARWA